MTNIYMVPPFVNRQNQKTHNGELKLVAYIKKQEQARGVPKHIIGKRHHGRS